jgi:hypothetical protein
MRRFVAYMVALSLVFVPILCLTAFLNPALVLPLLLVITGWFIWGAKVVAHRGIAVPLPAEHRIDVGNALRALWWTAWWPRYL